MKLKLPFLFLLFLSCQGPWDYYPENPENYRGIWTAAYIISGRHVENVCFDKMHALDEVRMQGFAFYESARVEITGSFDGKKTSVSLEPVKGKPNCLFDTEGLIAEAGENYELHASITWENSGKTVTSEFHAKTYIPQKFKVLRAYDLLGQPYSSGDEVLYLPPPMDLRSHYFIPEYSDDVSLALVTMVYGSNAHWGENSIDKIINQFSDSHDTARHAKFGDKQQLYSARNQEIAGINKDIDSIPILGINFPATGSVKLLFYATTNDYAKYEETYIYGANDSRVEPIYNILPHGAGIFAGMLVDTFEVNLRTLPDVKVYPNDEAQENYCLQVDDLTNQESWKLRQCLDIWDELIWYEIHCGYPFVEDGDNGKNDSRCLLPQQPAWHSYPEEKVKGILSKDDMVTWCEHRDFPIDIYPLCGSAMVYFYKQKGGKSAVLAREAKKWCEEHKDDEEC
ncbi:MAG: hypothetical protein LBB36_00770 [Fibromonadaceae bacterium]|jgi:hypothetical protein|nr:hypothetical protein [Fibromonadaceae bacterium]